MMPIKCNYGFFEECFKYSSFLEPNIAKILFIALEYRRKSMFILL